jgi:hypothetical protein
MAISVRNNDEVKQLYVYMYNCLSQVYMLSIVSLWGTRTEQNLSNISRIT